MSNIIIENRKIAHNITPKSYIKNLKNKIDDTKTSLKSITKKKIKVSDFKIPLFSDYEHILRYNYTVQQLKDICGFYGQRKTGNKSDLNNYLYSYLYLSNNVTKIQSNVRRYLVSLYFKLHGPAMLQKNRKLCVNDTDFYCLDDISDIPFNQFYSYCDDDDDIIYGFNISSLYEYYKIQKNNANPYTRKKIPSKIITDIKRIKILSRILKIPLELLIKKDEVDPDKLFELRVRKIFSNMDELGNYTEPQWFLSLNRIQLVKFIRELHDMWNYRLGLTDIMKRNICTRGNPFRSVDIISVITMELVFIKKLVLDVIEVFVTSGNNIEHKSLGTIYVLTALTLVNEDTATALPWLYQAANHA